MAGASNQVLALRAIPPHRASVAGSVLQLSQRSASAIGMALAFLLYSAGGGALVILGWRVSALAAGLSVCVIALTAAVVAAAVEATRWRTGDSMEPRRD